MAEVARVDPAKNEFLKTQVGAYYVIAPPFKEGGMHAPAHRSIASIFIPVAEIFFAFIILSSAATANTVVRFVGLIDTVSPGYEIPGIEVGDPVSGALVFDPAIPDGSPVSWIGYYPDAIVSFRVTIGSRTFSLSTAGSPASEIDVINDDNVYGTYYDQMWFRAAVEEAANPGVVRFLQLTFSTGAPTQPTVLLDDTLPNAPNLAAFDIRRGFITYMPPGASQGSNFALTDIQVIPIHEPLDLTGDGMADIVVRNMDTGDVFMWEMDGDVNTYYDISSLPLNREIVGIADLTGDGMSDIVLRNADTGYLYMWEMDGNLKTYYGISALPLNRTVLGLADLSGDGRADIVLRNTDTGYLYMWEMDGNVKTYRGISVLPLNREVVGLADLTGDGKAEIVLRNADTGYLYMWDMDNNTKTYYGISSLPLNREIVGIADLTGDGVSDIVLRNMDTGYLYMWEMDRNLKTYHGISSLPLNRQVVQIADLTGDGKADIVLRNRDTGYVYMWEMDGSLKTYYGISPLDLNAEIQP